MVKWLTCRNGYMAKCQNTMVFFYYLQQILSQPLINVRSGSEEGCPHHFLSHFLPYHNLHIYVTLLLPFLSLHVFPRIRLKLHSSLCILISNSSYPHSIPLCISLSNDLHPPLHIYLHFCIRIPLPLIHDVFPPLHLHLYPLYLPLTNYFPLHLTLTHDVCPPPHLNLHLCTLHLTIPLTLHSSCLIIPHYHLHPNHRSQIIHWLAALMPFLKYLFYEIVEYW